MFRVGDKVHRNVLVSSDHGLMLVNRFDYDNNFVGQGRCILDHGNMSTVEAQVCVNALISNQNKHPIIFDIGANIGTFTTWMAKFFEKGKIYCFEPQREVFKLLCANLSLNNLDNTYPFNLALGEKCQFVKIAEPDYCIPNDFGKFSLLHNNLVTTDNSLIIEMKTLDNFVEQFEVNKLDLIKVDAEGMDLTILKGAINTIERFFPILFIEHFNTITTNFLEIKFFLENFKYSYTVIENNILAVKENATNK